VLNLEYVTNKKLALKAYYKQTLVD